MPEQNTLAHELAVLLIEARALGLTFHVGSAYISRSYIDQQAALNARIDAALAKLDRAP